MGAAPSQIANHEQEDVTDTLGDAFAPGSSFYLTCGASGYKNCLSVDYAGVAKTKAVKDSPDRKWMIEYSGSDRTKVALRNVGTGKWLAFKNAAWESKTFLHGGRVFWFVYKGQKPNSFWLSTTQAPDCFLTAWDNVPGPGKDVLNLTSRHGKGYGRAPQLFEDNTAAMSWQLEWTPEYEQAMEATPAGKAAAERRKAQKTQEPEAASGTCCDRCGENCQVYQEAFAEVEQFKGQYADAKAALEDAHEQQEQLSKQEEELKKKTAAMTAQVKAQAAQQATYNKQLATLADQEKAATAKEATLKQQEIDLQKRDQDLDARQKAVLADENRKTTADRETARRKREEQAALSEEVQKKNEVVRRERRKEQADLAKLKAENSELQAKLDAALKEAQKARPAADGEADSGIDAEAELEKASLEADLEHALDLIAELQARADSSASPTTSSTTSTTAPGISSSNTTSSHTFPNFSIPPPRKTMPSSTLPKSTLPSSFPEFRIEAPETKRPRDTRPKSKVPGFRIQAPSSKFPESSLGARLAVTGSGRTREG